ncbi:hypothetical protein AK812_SmicGene16487 [Symbiodinium microadriaticum]|uniref:Uncharacterized protein n=1 Tax=Symbiodinium microadriaticum TaxID=2951 RepID=A0A1Q9E027_SYMMI|nr:hypothetical protein AK812_SmicGene16487 [Symbiodinium microadriaticum]
MSAKAPWKSRGSRPRQGESEYWQWWPGTWSPRQRQRMERYDDLQNDSYHGGHQPTNPDLAVSEHMKFMQELQRAVTQARKMDARVRKLQEDKVQKTKLWEKYSEDTKKKFLKNRQAYHSDMEKLDQAVAAATTAGQEAAELARQIVLRGAAAPPREDAMEVDHWSALLEREQGDYQDAPDSFLGRIMGMSREGAFPVMAGTRSLRPEIARHFMAPGGIPGQAGPPQADAANAMAATHGEGHANSAAPAPGAHMPMPHPTPTGPLPAPPGLAPPNAPPGYVDPSALTGTTAPHGGEAHFAHPEPFVGSPAPVMHSAGPSPKAAASSPAQRNKPPVPRTSVKQRPPIVTAPLTGPSLDSKLDATTAAALMHPVAEGTDHSGCFHGLNPSETRRINIAEGDTDEDGLDNPLISACEYLRGQATSSGIFNFVTDTVCHFAEGAKEAYRSLWDARLCKTVLGTFGDFGQAHMRPLRMCRSFVNLEKPACSSLHMLVAVCLMLAILAQQVTLLWTHWSIESLVGLLQLCSSSTMIVFCGAMQSSLGFVCIWPLFEAPIFRRLVRPPKQRLHPLWLAVGLAASPACQPRHLKWQRELQLRGCPHRHFTTGMSSGIAAGPVVLVREPVPAARALTLALLHDSVWPDPIGFQRRTKAARLNRLRSRVTDPPDPLPPDAPICFAPGEIRGPEVGTCSSGPAPSRMQDIEVLVHCPMYIPEHVRCRLAPTDRLPALLQDVQGMLSRLSLPFATELIPVFPQPSDSFATLVLGAQGLELTGQAIMLLDFRGFGGPLYSGHVCLAASHYELACFAAHQRIADWDVFLPGRTEPLAKGSRFRAEHGGLIKFVPANTVPNWGDSLLERLDRGSFELATDGWALPNPPSAVLLLDEDRRIALPRPPFCSGTRREAIARHVGLPQTRITLSKPTGHALHNVVHQGTPCSETIAVCRTPPARDSDDRGYFVFLDPRQLGKPITFVRLGRARIEIDYLARFTGIHSVPKGLFLSLCAGKVDGDFLEVQDGEVVSFGFVSQESIPEATPATTPVAHGIAASSELPPNLAGDSSSLCPPGPGSPHRQPAVIDDPECRTVNSRTDLSQDVPIETSKLLQEPESHNLRARQRIEQVRDETEDAGGIWPYLPATDEFAAAAAHMQTSDEEAAERHRLLFVVLTPGYNNVVVPVLLPAPSEIPDALQAVNMQRDPVQTRLFPYLGVVCPQPSNAYGTLYALPLWAAAEPFACFNLVQWDGRFYIECVPRQADRDTLLRLADIDLGARVHIFVGDAVEPLAPDQQVELVPGVCLFYQPMHLLPAPIFHLTDTLLSELPWQDDPPLPLGLAITNEEYVCAVAEMHYKAVGFQRSRPEDDIAAVAAAFRIPRHQLILLHAEPAIPDICVKGLRCTKLCTVLSTNEVRGVVYPDLPNLSFVDCRAMLQGWRLLIAETGIVPFDEFGDSFDVFCPAGWQLHLEGLETGAEGYLPRPRQTTYASYVMQPRSLTAGPEEQDDSEDPTDDMPLSDDDDSGHDTERRSPRRSSPGSHSRSRSPRGSQGDNAPPNTSEPVAAPSTYGPGQRRGAQPRPAREVPGGSGPAQDGLERQAQAPPGHDGPEPPSPEPADSAHGSGQIPTSVPALMWARFLIYTPETAPELIDIRIGLNETVNAVVAAIQLTRSSLSSSRFPVVIPCAFQPLQHFAIAVALPVWNQDVFILLDCSRCNGAVFCALSSPVTTRTALLAVARLPADTGIEVFVHDRLHRLEDGEVIEVHSGICVNFVPQAHPLFAVARLEDMLADPQAWDLDATPPHVEGRWIHVLTDTEPLHFRPALVAGVTFRTQIADALGCSPETLSIQPSKPRIWDYFDHGILAHSVFVVSRVIQRPPTGHADWAIYFLDARPVLRGVTWDVAPQGLVATQELSERFQPRCPPGRRVQDSSVDIDSSGDDTRALREAMFLAATLLDTLFSHFTVSFPESEQGELTALFWCLTWLLRAPAGVHITIFSDCTSAIGLSDGRFGNHNGQGLPGACRAVMQALGATTSVQRFSIQHVKSHVGHVGNELADRLAKHCNSPVFDRAFWPANPMQPFLRNGWLPWLWLYLEAHHRPEAWPAQLGTAFVDVPGPLPPLPTQAECEQMLGLQPQDESDSSCTHASMSALFLTVNVQSLHPSRTPEPINDDARPFAGRAGLIREQLTQLGIGVAALQETRAHSNELFQSKTHLRFVSSRDVKGSYGTEIWFSRVHPFILHPIAPIYFEPSDFLAVFWDPRVIAVRFARGSVKILFLSVHAPTSAYPGREDWWANLCRTIDRLRQTAQVVVLGDFNVHVDCSYNERVGDLVWPSTSPSPKAFWRLLDAFDLWLPSTYSCCHTGPSETWRSPSGNSTSRIDYIAIPTAWQVPRCGSCVHPELDWGQGRVDQYAAVVAAQAYLHLGAPMAARLPRLDTASMRTAEGASKIAAICGSLPLQPWHLDVHRHAAQIEGHFKALLPVAFPTKGARQRKSHLLPATWQLRNQRAWLRKRVHTATHFCHSFTVRVFLSAWRTGLPVWCGILGVWSRLLKSLWSLPGHLDALRRTSPELRARIKDDTRSHLHEVALQAVTSSTRDTVRRLQDLTGGPKRKQKGATPLPAVEISPGCLATTYQEAKDKWISHFSSIEDGLIREAQDLVHSCYRRQHAKDLSSYEVALQEAPCLAELETSLRASIADRAYGFDGVPGEVAKYGAPYFAKALFQLELKSILRLSVGGLPSFPVSLPAHSEAFYRIIRPLISGESVTAEQVLHQVRDELANAGYLARIPWHPDMKNEIFPIAAAPVSELSLSDATWMDDLLLFLLAPDSSTLLRTLSFGAASLLDACLQRALVPNLSRGKTEAMVHFCHKGSRQARRHLYGALNGELPLACRLWPEATLRIVPTYRSAQAWDAFRRRKQKLFGSPLVPVQDKSLLFDSLVATVLFYGSGTWPAVTEGHQRSLTSVLRQMACQMLRPKFTCAEAWHLGTSQALALAGIPQACTYLHVYRLRYLLSCIRLDTPELWALAHWEREWLSLVRSSIAWLLDLDGRPTHATEVEDELERPSAEVLHCLELIAYDHQVESHSPGMGPADFVDWLSTSPSLPATAPATLQQGEKPLDDLHITGVSLPRPAVHQPEDVVVFIGDPVGQWRAFSARPEVILYPHRDSLSRLERGETIDFLGEPDPCCGYCISLFGLPTLFRASCPAATSFEAELTALTLACDLTRLVLRLWARGLRACLITPEAFQGDIAFLSALPSVRSGQFEQGLMLWVGDGSSPFSLFHF